MIHKWTVNFTLSVISKSWSILKLANFLNHFLWQQLDALIYCNSYSALVKTSIDNTQDRNMREKWNPFHACFTVKTVRFRLAKLTNIWIENASCCSSVQNLEIPLKLGSFARETVLIFLSSFDVGCCLLQISWIKWCQLRKCVLKAMKKSITSMISKIF